MADATRQGDGEQLQAQASAWLSVLHSGEATERQRAEFRAWLAADARHRAAFRHLDALWTSLDLLPRIEDALVARPRPLRSVLPGGRRWLQRSAAALAAGLAVLVAGGLLRPPARIDVRIIETRIGEVREVDLGEGSLIVMRADSSIRVSMSKRLRHVAVSRGGVYFDLARDPQRPFVVSAAEAEIRVLGTAFDVLRGPRGLTVSVTRGEVAVTPQPPGRSRDTAVLALSGGQQLRIAADGRVDTPHAFDGEQLLSWREGWLSYTNARLEDIVADVNRYRALGVVIDDPALKDLRISTSFRVDRSDQMLAGIALSEALTVSRQHDSVVIRPRRVEP